LADEKRLSASSINQALNALVFTYTKVLDVQLSYLKIPHVRRTKNLQVALSTYEAQQVLNHLSGEEYLIVALMYGSGLRVNEACSLRVKDLDLAHAQIVVRESKGGDHRVTILPEVLLQPLQNHLEVIKYQHQEDLRRGHGFTWIPTALRRKYPNAETDWQWHYVFPSRKLSRHNQEPNNPRLYRFHKSPYTIGKAVKKAANVAGIDKRVTPHVFRHTFATQLRRQGYEVEQIQKLLGHKKRETTMRYLHGVEVDISRITSPLDAGIAIR
jgi:integron integrase